MDMGSMFEETSASDQFWLFIAMLGRECREWAQGATDAEIENWITGIYKKSVEHDRLCFSLVVMSNAVKGPDRL